MSSVNPQRGRVTWQNDFNCNFDSEGGVVATQTYAVLKNELLSTKPAKGTSCNESGFEALLLKSASVSYHSGDYYMVTCTFAASETTYSGGGGNAEFGETFHTNVAVNMEPIESHWKFKDLGEDDFRDVALYKAGKIVRDASDPTKFKKQSYNEQTRKPYLEDYPDISTDTSFLLLLKWLDAGLTEYKNPTIQYKHRWQGKNQLSSSALNNIGKKDNPSGNPPPLNNDRDWVLIGANSDEDDGIYQHEVVWEASGAGGVVGELYED